MSVSGTGSLAATSVVAKLQPEEPLRQSRVVGLPEDYNQATTARRLSLHRHEDETNAGLRSALAVYGIEWLVSPAAVDTEPRHLNADQQQALSQFVRRSGIKLPDLVELFRGQTTSDRRPNKALDPEALASSCPGYPQLGAALDVMREGVRVPLLRQPQPQTHRPENHQSARDRLQVLRKNIRKEQDAGRCIVVDLDLLALWPEVIISPYGVVDKAGSDPLTAGRTIQNLSFPPGRSVNDVTNKTEVPTPDYQPVESVALEILRLRDRNADAPIYMLAGDVALAFRHVHLHSSSVHLFGGAIPEDNALVIELARPFGWTDSPGFYELFGGAISHIHGSTSDSNGSNPFFSYHWVDDHVLVSWWLPDHPAILKTASDRYVRQ